MGEGRPVRDGTAEFPIFIGGRFHSPFAGDHRMHNAEKFQGVVGVLASWYAS
jgi:hypothetical protein